MKNIVEYIDEGLDMGEAVDSAIKAMKDYDDLCYGDNSLLDENL